MAFKNLEELEKGIAAAGQSWSDADRALARKSMDYGNSLYTLKNNWTSAMQRGDTAAAQDAHDRAEDFRKRYGGYSGGADGSGYIKDSTYFNYTDPYEGTLNDLAASLVQYGKFENPYREQADRVLESYLGRGPFSYDLDSDPIWQQYRKTYLREGQRAREDTLGNYAAATGGQSSTAAVNAASQAQDYYNAQMADKVPELYKLNYDMWLGEGSEYANQLDALRGLGSDALNEWNANRALLTSQLSGVQNMSDSLYGRALDKWTSDYKVDRDSLADTRYDDETAYSRGQDAYNHAQDERDRALSQALEWMKLGVQPSEAVVSAAGLAGSDVQNYLNAVQAQMAAASTGRRSSGSGSSKRSGGSSSAGQDYEGLFQRAAESGRPQSFIENHYKEYGFTSKSGLYSEYKAEYENAANAQSMAGLQDGLRFCSSKVQKSAYIDNAQKNGLISQRQAQQLRDQAGIK